jgi:periplasmic divalent cation tolerance protein
MQHRAQRRPVARMSAYRFVYITTRDEAEAARIGEALVRERLAACANVIGPIRSFYWWEGAVQDEREAVLVLKSRRELIDSLVARVKALHSYSCPCVVALEIAEGDPDFLRWIGEETRPAASAEDAR